MAAPTNYKAFYKLKANANDETGFYDATVNGTPTFKDLGVLLNGTTDYFSLPRLGIGANFSFSFWFSTADVTKEQENAYSHKDDDIYVSNKIKSSKLALYAYDGTDTEVLGTTTLLNDTWYMATYVYRDNGICQLYLDSDFENDITIGTLEDDGPQGSPYIGTNVSEDANFFDGCMANYRVYNYDLGAAQVLAIYEEEKVQFYPHASGTAKISGSAKGLDSPRSSGSIKVSASADAYPAAFADGSIKISGVAHVTQVLPKINISGYLQSIVAANLDFKSGPIHLDGTLDAVVNADQAGEISADPIHLHGILDASASASELIASPPVSVSIEGTLSVSIVASQTTEDNILMTGTLDSHVVAGMATTLPEPVSMSGELLSEVSGNIPAITIDPVSMEGTLSSSVNMKIDFQAYSAMYGFLTVNIASKNYQICYDINADMIIQEIVSEGCDIGVDNMPLIRYRGDTYPVFSRLSRNGNPDISAYTFKLSTQLDGDTLYTSTGTITDSANGLVEFEFDPLAIDTAGEGVYDVEGDDGSYIYTFEKGTFELLQDVTP